MTGANAPGRGPRIPGLAIGVVTDVREPNGSQRGAVRLQFPWLDDTYVTDWVRTVQWGGKGGGGVVSPEVNDEVLVGFEQGLLDSPYVIGGLYNGVDQPSPHDVPLIDKTSGKVNRRSVVSRSGHRVELLDARAPGPSGLRLVTGDERLEVRMDDRRDRIELTVYAGRGRPLTSVLLDKNGITLDARRGTVKVSGRAGGHRRHRRGQHRRPVGAGEREVRRHHQRRPARRPQGPPHPHQLTPSCSPPATAFP